MDLQTIDLAAGSAGAGSAELPCPHQVAFSIYFLNKTCVLAGTWVFQKRNTGAGIGIKSILKPADGNDVAVWSVKNILWPVVI